MKKNAKTISLILGMALGAALPLAAHAQATMPGMYVGIAGGQAEPLQYDVCDTRTICKKKGSAYRVFGGWQFNRNFGVEAAFSDLGKASSSSATVDETIKVRVSELTLVGSYPATERFAIYGKVGGYYAQSTADTTTSGVTQRLTESNGGITFAGGLQFYMMPSLALRGEGQRYMKVGGGKIGDSDYTAYTIGLLWKFR
jgi:OOP family OmpA-OmpF porin